MPASTLDAVNGALRAALDDGRLDEQLAAASKKALLADVDFEAAGSYQTTVLDKLKNKYIVLKSQETPQPSKPDGDQDGDDTLKQASRELFPLESVQLGWSSSPNNPDWSVGTGMMNMGNTCYLNSTLQALFHVPALVNWLVADQREHATACHDCIICAMRKTLHESQQRNAACIRPLLIYNKLRHVCRNLIPGRQEDAHEFLRCLVEAMEKAYLGRFDGHQSFDSRVKETTPLNQILGGYLRSAVRCLKCGHVSTTFQHFQDLLLDIRKAQTVDEALEGYFCRERLDDEMYQCQACQKKVPATKQFFLERAPMVLCIQLKRFSVSNNKITKQINFRQRLDLTRYARHRPSVPLIYRLVALITHMGPTVNCGHYTAVAQTPSGNFYQFDDSMVRVISHQAVFNTNAYIMLYELESSPFTSKTNPIVKSSPQTTESSSPSTTLIMANGIGFTSDKVYGPELPPDRVLNGSKNETSSSSSSSSESESETSKPPPPPPPLPTTTNDTTPTKLVPYETDDSSSETSNEAPPYRVSTKAAVAEWKVTSMEPVKKENTPTSNNTTVNELYRMSHSGYSAPVTSWNGTRSQLEKEVGSERRTERKRSYDDKSNDRGRIKHVKMGGSYKSNPGYNPVQEFHNGKKWNHYKPFYASNRHRRNFHRKNFHKNFHFRQ